MDTSGKSEYHIRSALNAEVTPVYFADGTATLSSASNLTAKEMLTSLLSTLGIPRTEIHLFGLYEFKKEGGECPESFQAYCLLNST